MKCNVGFKDAIARIVFGIVIFIIFVSLESWWFLLGWIPISTAFLEFCPVYSVLGINTMQKEKKFWG